MDFDSTRESSTTVFLFTYMVHNSQYTNLHSLGLRKAAIFPIPGFLNVVCSWLSLEFGMITE